MHRSSGADASEFCAVHQNKHCLPSLHTSPASAVCRAAERTILPNTPFRTTHTSFTDERLPWVEKYRPRGLDEVISHQETINTSEFVSVCLSRVHVPHPILARSQSRFVLSALCSRTLRLYDAVHNCINVTRLQHSSHPQHSFLICCVHVRDRPRAVFCSRLCAPVERPSQLIVHRHLSRPYNILYRLTTLSTRTHTHAHTDSLEFN
jgi:hypothetical protein